MTGPGIADPAPGTALVIAWHSRTGAAQAMADAAAQGAIAAAHQMQETGGESGTDRRICLVGASDASPELLLAASGYVFVCPENLGSMSGIMKDMFDRAYYPLLDRVAGRAYATIIAAGSDGYGAQAQIDRIATGWRLRRVADPIVIGLDAQTPQAILARKTVPGTALERCRALGAAMLSGIALGVF